MLSEERCAHDFGLGKPLREFVAAGRGQTNPMEVLRLETDRGLFAVKRWSDPPHAAAMRVERAAFEAGVPMPRPVLTVGGTPVAMYPRERGRLWVRVYSWIDGEAGDWGNVSEQASFQVGGIMAKIHGLQIPLLELVEERWVPPGTSGWAALAQRATSQRREWADLLREKVDILVAAERALERAASCRHSPSQRDYHPPNVIEQPDGRRVLVDWDSAGAAVARQEALRFALIWATPDRGGPLRELVKSFIRGYRDAGGELPSPALDELLDQAHPPVWWIWFNVRRELDEQPTPLPGLTAALLSGVKAIDVEEVERVRMLFE
jgi:hypothetical protein